MEWLPRTVTIETALTGLDPAPTGALVRAATGDSGNSGFGATLVAHQQEVQSILPEPLQGGRSLPAGGSALPPSADLPSGELAGFASESTLIPQVHNAAATRLAADENRMGLVFDARAAQVADAGLASGATLLIDGQSLRPDVAATAPMTPVSTNNVAATPDGAVVATANPVQMVGNAGSSASGSSAADAGRQLSPALEHVLSMERQRADLDLSVNPRTVLASAMSATHGMPSDNRYHGGDVTVPVARQGIMPAPAASIDTITTGVARDLSLAPSTVLQRWAGSPAPDILAESGIPRPPAPVPPPGVTSTTAVPAAIQQTAGSQPAPGSDLAPSVIKADLAGNRQVPDARPLHGEAERFGRQLPGIDPAVRPVIAGTTAFNPQQTNEFSAQLFGQPRPAVAGDAQANSQNTPELAERFARTPREADAVRVSSRGAEPVNNAVGNAFNPLPRDLRVAAGRPLRQPVSDPLAPRASNAAVAPATEISPSQRAGHASVEPVPGWRSSEAAVAANLNATRVANGQQTSSGLARQAPAVEAPVTQASAANSSPIVLPSSTPSSTALVTAAATPLPSIDVPVTDRRWGDVLNERVIMMTGNKLQRAEIRLNPAELGPVRIEIRVDDDGAQINFVATQSVTREAIEQALPRLRELLSSEGLNLQGATINDHGVKQGKGEGAEQRQMAGAGHEASDSSDDDAVLPESARRPDPDALVDTFA